MRLAHLHAGNASQPFLEMSMFAALNVMQYQPHGAMAPHEHDHASLNIVVAGGFQERIGKDDRVYARGQIAFCPAGVTHSQKFGKGGARQIIFRPQDSWLAYLSDCNINLADAPYTGSPSFRHLGDRLLDELARQDDFSPFACEGILLEIIAALGRHGATANSAATPPSWLRAAREFLHENAGAPFNMARIAQAAGRHEIHVAREFRRFYGTSVGAYLRGLRTDKAAQLLAATQDPITDIALACGFASHSHLCREFKARFGVMPSRYRARTIL
jgi:AraC family transcriptional regulator